VRSDENGRARIEADAHTLIIYSYHELIMVMGESQYDFLALLCNIYLLNKITLKTRVSK
jgi:hypothetical protein